MEALMASNPEFQEGQAPVQLDRLLDAADRCLVRQLRVLSRIGGHPAQIKSAEAVFKTMLQTQETMAQTHEILTQTKIGAELQSSPDAENHLAKRAPQLDNDGRPRPHWNSDQEATWLLGS